MVRRGVGVVVVAVAALAGCGSSDEDEVASLAKQLARAAQRHDAAKLCHELLHPNTVHAIERMARAEAIPGGPQPSCEQKYRTSQAGSRTIDGRDPTADDVTIKGNVAYLTAEANRKRPFARRDGGKWKIDFTADPEIGWVMQASLACVHWQQALQRRPVPPASREGIIADLRGDAAAMTTFRRELDAAAATGEEKTPAADLAASLTRMNARLESVAAALQRGRSLEATTNRASKATQDEGAEILRAANAANVQCGRIPAVAPDGAAFRRKANALCEPVVKEIMGMRDPGASVAAATRYLRRASALERGVSRELAALRPPADLDRVYRDTLSTLAGLGATLRAEGAAIARGDPAGAQRAVARLPTLDYRKSVGFNRLGLQGCASL
jgi:hypothetical protein